MLVQFESKFNKQPVYINVNKIIAIQQENDEYSKIYMQDGEDSYFTVKGKVEDIALRINNYESHRLPVPESSFERAAKELIKVLNQLK